MFEAITLNLVISRMPAMDRCGSPKTTINGIGLSKIKVNNASRFAKAFLQLL